MQLNPQVIEYLTPREHSFWMWNREEAAITWKSGQTIVFSVELAQILAPLCSMGFPALDLIVLLAASTRDSWALLGDDTEIDALLMGYLSRTLGDSEACSRVAASLDRIALLSSDLRHGISTKSLLLQSLLAKHPTRCSAEQSRVVVEILEQGGLPELEFDPWPLPYQDIPALAADLCLLSRRIYQLGDDNIRSLMTASIEAPITAAPLESLPSPSVEARTLIQSLQVDDEHQGLGRLSRDLLGVLHRTPKLSYDRSLATGGLSDIFNRGTPDRLLLSELAYDSDTLAVRIANNEAMYFRREPPPQNPPLERCILLENSIRAWGTPRLYAAAVGLALVALAEKNSLVHVWRADGDQVIDVHLQDREGLVKHLEALTAELHPGEALAEYLTQANRIAEGSEKFLITTYDAWHDSEFQKLLKSSSLDNLSAIVLDRDGKLEIIECSRAGQHCVRTAQLDLAQLLITHAQLPSKPSEFPRILDLSPFPLRLPVQAKNPFLVNETTVVAKSYDGRLLLKSSDQYGAIQVRDTCVSGPVVWANVQGEVGYVLAGPDTNRNHCLVAVDLSGNVSTRGMQVQPDIVTSTLVDCVSFRIEAKCLIGYSTSGATAVSLSSGAVLATHRWNPKNTQSNSVYRNQLNGWSAVRFDGTKFSESQILTPAEASEPGSEVQLVVERVDRKGFLVFTRGGEVINSADGRRYSIPGFSGDSDQISHILCFGNGHWVVLDCKSLTRNRYIVLRFDQQGNVSHCPEPASPHAATFAHDRIAQGMLRLPNMSFRNRFSRVGIVKGKLALERNRSLLTLHIEHHALVWRSSSCTDSQPLANLVDFEMLSASSTGRGYRLEKANVHGCDIYLDGRGLLHLKNPRSLGAEVTIVLRDGVASGYCSDGKLFGEPAYIEREPGCNVELIRHDLRALDIGIE